MPPITVPNQEASVGIPTQWSQDINAPLGALFLSAHPPGITYDEIVAFSQNLAAFTVVGFNALGEVVQALIDTVTPANTIKPIGVLTIPVVTPASGEKKSALIWRQGHFNINRLVWHSSFSTKELKLDAFKDSPTPTVIRLGEPRTYTP